MADTHSNPINDDNIDDSATPSENQLLEHMAVMQEPPFDPEDTPATGIYPRVDPHKTNPRITDRVVRPRSGGNWLNWLFSAAALVVTIVAGAIYLQQNNTPQPAIVPTTTD